MKLAEVCPYSVSVPGGVQGQVLALSRSMRNLGHEVDVVAPCDEPTVVDEIVALGRTHEWWANGSLAPISISPKMWGRLRGIFSHNSYDIVHLHEPFTPFVGVATMALSDAPVAGTFHRSGASAIYKAYARSLGVLSGRLELRFAVSEEARSTAYAVTGRDSLVVGNGVDLTRFSSVAPWRKDAFTVMFIGRHEPRKGLEILLEAFRYLDLTHEIELWVAGDGPESLKLRAKYKKDPRIKWLGRVSEAEAAARMRASDVVVAPSLFGESFGVVLLEAMACKSVVVASNIDGYRELVRHRVDGILVPPGDPTALASVIYEVIHSKDMAATLTENALAKAETYSIDGLAKRYLDSFTEQLNG
ncbi:phosphatidylinositol alpha-mannosyltransferase [Ferrithrix thermotolerans DSM 19514]|uniref:Phosphatidylinositol alpha-mannosyltransferase n=1 Tax=Ferrithrix thermotolerans DSM 19514 TaxID=1121881 RepID=A0A1M4SIQ4_9ACTN|nr:phosphatidylinositol alpha-mannosyltransferase [Ferrithrix thermotolerans DSM 19514]